MSLNLEGIGATLATIKDDPKFKNKVVSVSADDMEGMPSFKTLKIKNGRIQPIGDWTKERSVQYIVGASGSGKSHFIREWCKTYKAKFKKNPVYLFSSLEDDETLDTIKPSRVILDEEFVNEDIDLELYRDSCCIFDDCDTIQHKHIRSKVYTLMNMMLNTGRHYNISVFSVNHTPTGSKTETKTILNECHNITYFPANDSKQLRYLLENYCGLDIKQQKFLKGLGSRWVSVYKHFPQVVLTEKAIIMMSEINK
jgi:hypothetical protein